MNASHERTIVSAVNRIGLGLPPLDLQFTDLTADHIRLARRLAHNRGIELEVRQTDPNRIGFFQVNDKEFCLAFTCL